MVTQIKNLACNKPYTASLGNRRFVIKNGKDAINFLRMREKFLRECEMKKETKDKIVQIRFTKRHFESLRKLGDKHGLSMATLGRHIIIKFLDKNEPVEL